MRENTLLNGFWDFFPVVGELGQQHMVPAEAPAEGWLSEGIIVPGSWAKGFAGVDIGDKLSGKEWADLDLFDNYGYPEAWDAMKTAWYRRQFTVDAIRSDRRYLLHFGGILREAWIFVNGREVGHSVNGILPFECDVTDAVSEGENELVVYVTDYRGNSEGKVYTPNGADQMLSQKGIWQDVTLKSVPAVRVQDVTIQTSVRKNILSLSLELINQSDAPQTVVPRLGVLDGALSVMDFEGASIELAAGESRVVELDHDWSDFRVWSHHDPHLYWLETELWDGEFEHPTSNIEHPTSNKEIKGEREPRIVDIHRQRFGFREVWIEGQHVMLNGAPVHMAGDWSHRLSMESLTTEYFKKWFGMLKDCNMNYVRTHTYPHPANMLELADEMGILISLEAGWHFGSKLALDEEELWQGALQHVRDIIKRDKNHPSIILWSVGNEVRWSGNQPAIIKNVPRLRELYEELDPTRPAYHDGDSSLWDERKQSLLSRHYGLECTGEGWWDKKQPLHVGEIGKWHYGQPIDNCIWGDDSVFASFEECHKAVAHECADQIEQGRAHGVCCVFPWNLSGLDNFRPWAEERKFDVKNPESSGIKPLRSAPYGSEFAWWDEDGKGYEPGVGFGIIKDSLRPVAVIVREKLSRIFSDQEMQHTVTVVNDTVKTIKGELQVELTGGEASKIKSELICVDPGRTECVTHYISLPSCDASCDLQVVTRFVDGEIVLDQHERPVRVVPASDKSDAWDLPTVALMGSDNLFDILQKHQVDVVRVNALAELDSAKTPLLLMGANTVKAGSVQNLELKAFLERGGRAIVLEQTSSIMPGVAIDLKPAERCHIRGGQHGVLEGLNADDFAFWGNDPYGKSDSDAWVTVNPYRKDSLPGGHALLHSGQGDFGSDGLYWSPLVDAQVGEGLLVASQLRVDEKVSVHPVARRLLKQYLEYAARWKTPAEQELVSLGIDTAEEIYNLGAKAKEAEFTDDNRIALVKAESLTEDATSALADSVQAGGTAIIQNLTPDSAELVAKAFDVELETVDLGTQYMLLRKEDDPLLEGISNQETCWLQKMQYSKPERLNRPMTQWLLRSKDAKELLVSESESCWHEFYLDGACSENLRMPVVSHLLKDGVREYAAGLLLIKHGKGSLILSQMPLPQDSEHYVASCCWSQLLTNLGIKFDANVLDGECVKAGSMRSSGYPVEIGYICDPDQARLAKLIQVGRPTEYRIHNHALVHGFDWNIGEFEDGTFVLNNGNNPKCVVISFQINAGRPRMLRYAEDGLPDPTQQTLCDLGGRGTVRPIVNGREFDVINLGEDQKGVVPDIDLNMDWNTIILVWEPEGESLNISWRDRQRNPEVEFAFMFKDTKFLSGAVHQ